VGTWSAALYGDDTALDLKADWQTRLRWGGKADDLTDQLEQQYGADDSTFWLVLADLQWKSGHLVPRVRDRALAIISGGEDLARWKDASAADQSARRAVLAKLAAQLAKPPPPAKTFAPPKGANTTMKPGEIWAWRLLDGRYTFFQVVAFDRSRGFKVPEMRVLDLVSDRVPPLAELAALPSRKMRKSYPKLEAAEPMHGVHPLMAVRMTGPVQFPKSRLELVGRAPIPAGLDGTQKSLGCAWPVMDNIMHDVYGLGWWVGDVLGYTRGDEPPLVLIISMIGTVRDGDVVDPYMLCQTQEWSRPTMPGPDDLPALRHIEVPLSSLKTRLDYHMLRGLPPASRLQHLGRVPREPQDAAVSSTTRWDRLDDMIAKGYFKLRSEGPATSS
jgi:hypothetical protein